MEYNLIEGPIFLMAFCELALIGAFCPQNAKRKKNGICVLLYIVLLLGVLALDFVLVDTSNASTALESPLCFLTALLYLKLTHSIDWKTAIYCGIWAFFFTELISQCVMPITYLLPLSLWGGGVNFLLRLVIYAAVVGAVRPVLSNWIVPYLQNEDSYHMSNRKLALSLLILAFYLLLGNYQFIFWLLGYEPNEVSTIITVFRLIVEAGCICVLLLQSSIEKKMYAEQELALNQQLWLCQKNQYQLSQENIDLINRKCHDLKHQMQAIRYLKDSKEMERQMREMEQAVLIYEAAVHTGNEVLDVILTEKNLYCEAHQITMTCMADASGLDRVDQIELYTMFGNALDNAIESVSKLDDPEKRIIQILIHREQELVLIRIRNYFEGELTMRDGLPASSKVQERGYHGYGLKSIRAIAEKYGGTLSVQTAAHYFTLQILIPCGEP